jgi:hypothetical protein
MYACFKHVPKKARQEAFDFLAKNGYGERPPNIRVLTQNSMNEYVPCCPLGAINKALGLGQVIIDLDCVWAPSIIYMPANGETEVEILTFCHSPVDMNARDAQRFIDHNDKRRFDTLEKLARAMGATYQLGE